MQGLLEVGVKPCAGVGGANAERSPRSQRYAACQLQDLYREDVEDSRSGGWV